jgi:phosphatidylserine/phosphatidylglycerophosphate/cardiolipin synthase-like enzyme
LVQPWRSGLEPHRQEGYLGIVAARGPRRDRVVIDPAERRAAVLRLIRGARRRLALTIFRCDDGEVLDAIGAAVARGVEVDVLLTRRARGWRRRLDRLHLRLERLGVRVTRHGAPETKHHAKYAVADGGPLLVASFNLTRKCFSRTCDFGVLTWDPATVADAWRLFDADLARRRLRLSPLNASRLVIGPESAGPAVRALLAAARRHIRIIDHKLDDPRVVRLLERKVRDGVRVDHLAMRVVGRRDAHGKVTIVDSRVALVGSLALSATSLGRRRELSLLVHEPCAVRRLAAFFDAATA